MSLPMCLTQPNGVRMQCSLRVATQLDTDPDFPAVLFIAYMPAMRPQPIRKLSEDNTCIADIAPPQLLKVAMPGA